MKKTLFFCLLLISSINAKVRAQNSQVIITNPACPDGTYLSFGCPVDENPDHYIDAADNFIFHKGTAVRTFSWATPVFIMIAGNQYCPKTRIIVCPDDTVRINISEKGDISFAGNNAAGIQEYNNGNALIGGHVPIGEDIFALKSKNELISALEKQKEIIFHPMARLYDEGKISHIFFDYVKKEADQVFANAIKGRLYAAKKLSDKEQDEVKIHFFRKYNPYNPVYDGIRTAFRSKSDMAVFVEKGLLPKTNHIVTGLWNENESSCNYLPLDIQEQLYASKLQVLHSIMGMMTGEQFKAGINKLKNISPNSVYLPALLKMTGDDAIPDNALGVFVYDKTNALVRIGEFKSMDLPAMVKKYFNGVPVLVDLWATYCAPCKSEFKYKEELDEFLKTKGIKLLYGGLDYPNNSKRWADDVVNYKLHGTHYFMTSDASDSLEKLTGALVTIPRYLLFDSEGNLVSSQLPRPSGKEAMYDEISRLLDK